MATIKSPQHQPGLVIATRLHLGKQSTPPPQTKLNSTLLSFLQLSTSCGAQRAAIAVDPAPKIDGYDLVSAIRAALDHARNELLQKSAMEVVQCDIVPVTPWGNFIPALNALISWACTTDLGPTASSSPRPSLVLFVSAETNLPPSSLAELCSHVDLEDTLVAGAALPGHDYRGEDGGEEARVELNGLTCPWNTLAVWNLKKLALTGFPLVADGLHHYPDGSTGASGIEEFSTVLLHQNAMSQQADGINNVNAIVSNKSKAKLVKISDVKWEQDFDGDEERKKWHESKMKSKFTRAERHRELLNGMKGWVIHC